MSVLGASVSCVPQDAEHNDTVNSDSASVLDADTVQNTNTHKCRVEVETLNDNELLKGLLTDTFCQVCDAVLLFESQRVSHYEGKKHAQRVRIYLQTKKAERNKPRQEIGIFRSDNVGPDKFCELCNMVFSSCMVARSHYKADVRSAVGSPYLPVPTGHGALSEMVQDQKENTVSTPQWVDLDNPEKYCKLCTASFNNPLIAQQHYSGRKHQRNQARQELLCKLGEESEHVHSLTCPVCCVTLSSIETYQAHMQGNKHHLKEKKIAGLCKSQKKVYDSFQDELADYIQVQRARGLEPKTGQGPEGPEHGTAEEEAEDTAQDGEVACRSAAPPSLHKPQWLPPFQPRITQFDFRGRFPVQKEWNQGYPSLSPPLLISGLTGRSLHRGRSPDSSSTTSFSSSSSSSSYTSSSGSSSISSSEDGGERRRRRRKRRDGARGRREQDDDSVKDTERRHSTRRSRNEAEEEQGHARQGRRQRRMSFEEEQREQGVGGERRKWKERRPRGRVPHDSEDYGRNRRTGQKNKRHTEGPYGKRWRGEGEEQWSKASVEERGEGGEPAMMEGTLGDRPGPADERAKCKREKKKKLKEKMGKGDTRTEEEKLWDETILGLF
ncbi:hypothetical protein P4O66_016871 [Electrophorus voltai]|uniref:C2H2-type domain-containing protein n=1 Tax=Electrophorus voltai TaxID=2609070 RepID=A0AAD8YZ11_9TELE|nr:hypothetical protein P4O66_016871 [Electrophorus voltai]